MRMATFNIENLDLPVEARLPVLRPALERLEADIVCLQEVNGQRGPGERARSL
jgi:exonuclease III